jgi:hypothetical protein
LSKLLLHAQTRASNETSVLKVHYQAFLLMSSNLAALSHVRGRNSHLIISAARQPIAAAPFRLQQHLITFFCHFRVPIDTS